MLQRQTFHHRKNGDEPWSSGWGRRLMIRRSWVQIFHAPFIWIKALKLKVGQKINWHCCVCCNPAKGRVDLEELLAYKIQLHGGNKWIESLSTNWDQCPPQNPKKKNIRLKTNIFFRSPAKTTVTLSSRTTAWPRASASSSGSSSSSRNSARTE